MPSGITTKYPMSRCGRRPAQHAAAEPGRLGLLLARDGVRLQRLHTSPVRGSTRPGLRGLPQGVASDRRPVDLGPQRQRDHVRLAGLLRHQRRPPTWNGETGEPDGHDLPDPGVSRPVVLGHHRHATSSTRRRSPPSTGCTPRHVLLAGAGRRPEQLRADVLPRGELHQAQPGRGAELTGRRRAGARDDPAAVERPGVRRGLHGRGLQEQRPDLQRRQPDLQRDGADHLGGADRPIPASNTPYLWRVRRADSAGNLGPWSATASFISSGTAPSLLTPKASRRSAARPRSSSGPRCRERRGTC